ncbi:MAG: hypothetical protein MZV63_08090 [Marinilabiliales bacterium]|nr:hypothetical protein [Marinilabiliales bacterium]
MLLFNSNLAAAEEASVPEAEAGLPPWRHEQRSIVTAMITSLTIHHLRSDFDDCARVEHGIGLQAVVIYTRVQATAAPG